MARIKTVKCSTSYQTLVNQAHACGERNDCSVKAVALATGASYTAAHNALAARGRKEGKGAYTHQILDAVRLLGKEVEFFDMGALLRSYPAPFCNVMKNITTHHPRRFAKVWPKGTFLMFTVGHVLTVIDGEVHDWTVNKTKRIISIYRVK